MSNIPILTHPRLHNTTHNFEDTDPAMGAWIGSATGRYFQINNHNSTTQIATANRGLWALFMVNRTTTYDRICCEVTVGGVGGTPVIRMGIYEALTTGAPGALVLDAGTIDSTAIAVKEITISQSLDPGAYFLYFCSEGATTTEPTFRALNHISMDIVNYNNATNLSGVGWFAANANAAPDPAPAVSIIGVVPRMLLRQA